MSSKKKVILVPVDFSEQSLIALGQWYNLAREYNAELLLLYVTEDKGGALAGIFTKSKQYDAEFKKIVEENLQKLADETEKKSKIKTNILVAHGSVYEKISEVAEMNHAIMIIMGCHSQKAGKTAFIGSNALRVVRESKIPVITIKGKHHRDGCKNIVLPLDLTKETKEKVDKAIELARLNDAVVHVVSVLFTVDEFVVNRLSRQLGQVKQFIEKAGVKCTDEIIKGIKGEESLADNVISYANKVKGDLLLIMTQREVGFTKYFIGSAAQEIILNSDIPVMSIIPSERKDTTVFTPY